MNYWLYEVLPGGSLKALVLGTKAEAIAKAKRLHSEWDKAEVERHYRVYYYGSQIFTTEEATE